MKIVAWVSDCGRQAFRHHEVADGGNDKDGDEIMIGMGRVGAEMTIWIGAGIMIGTRGGEITTWIGAEKTIGIGQEIMTGIGREDNDGDRGADNDGDR